jgi:ribosomal protein S27AE
MKETKKSDFSDPVPPCPNCGNPKPMVSKYNANEWYCGKCKSKGQLEKQPFPEELIPF